MSGFNMVDDLATLLWGMGFGLLGVGVLTGCCLGGWFFGCKPRRRVVGMRRPGTPEGAWQDAYVAGIDSNGGITAAYFENNRDYIGHPASWAEVERELHALAQKGWMPMTRDDLRSTAGIRNFD